MKNEVRCKACGYIMSEGRLKDVCPACGVPKTAFEPYKDTLSEKRRFILDLHIHPIVIHFPQAFASILPVLIIAGILLKGQCSDMLLSALTVLIYLLPFTVAAAIVSGLIDGKTRFKSLITIALKQKIGIAMLLLLLSVIMGIYTFINPVTTSSFAVVFVLSIACVGCEIALGQIGNKLMEPKLPG
ncbi:MAG: rubrerythrin [Spirochaetes bacterium]|nr:rubrerythrin [Spirochaetota bacterium]